MQNQTKRAAFTTIFLETLVRAFTAGDRPCLGTKAFTWRLQIFKGQHRRKGD